MVPKNVPKEVVLKSMITGETEAIESKPSKGLVPHGLCPGGVAEQSRAKSQAPAQTTQISQSRSIWT